MDLDLHLEFLVEESSLKEALNHLLPKILGDKMTFKIHPFRGKDDLLKKLPDRLKGYKAWMPENYKIIVLIDEDRQDCKELKQKLEKIALDTGLVTKSSKIFNQNYSVINRIVIEELEACFFGDPEAIHQAYPKISSTLGEKAKYRHSDSITGGTWEALEKELQTVGYYAGGLSKNEAARNIAAYMQPERNTSPSFKVFYHTLLELQS